ncbi:5'-methylthioadenosine/adenosylhomocysteine nucleosidase [Persicobacter psychrovividus]|uniref:adenosylhomocysteine nucleosidase n=1 Tax=Persicobacter psychrovividus TaxID=387638 RepID=A0ABN6LGR8_9BACT|nr:5'-methylthioadenosine/S-adenosylhomocysteine nucleosidase [Persicobacter psychrovividus]
MTIKVFKPALIGLLLCVFCSTITKAQVAILGAMDKEITDLKSQMSISDSTLIAGQWFYQGTIADKPIILTKSGVGKVNAALTATLLLDHFKAESLWFTGIAGAANPHYKLLDVVVSESLLQHDFDARPFDAQPALVPSSDKNGYFHADPQLVTQAFRAAQQVVGKAHAHCGIIVTGDQFIADHQKVEQLRKDFRADAIEMEGAAVAQVAHRLGKPFVIIRSISDQADGEAEMTYPQMAKNAAAHAMKIIVRMLEQK